MNTTPPFPPTISLKPFQISIPEHTLAEFKTLLQLSKLPPRTYEGQHSKFGVTNEWMVAAKREWETGFDWRAVEKRINGAYPQFIADVPTEDGGEAFPVHFMASFAADPGAVPLLLLHGWPGSFLEFFPLLEVVSRSETPRFHVIVPSLPGYCFSGRQSVERDFTMVEAAGMMNRLMTGLGFEKYIVQAGDVGSYMARMMTRYSGCRGVHLNMFPTGGDLTLPPPGTPDEATPLELQGLTRMKEFMTTGNSYAMEHATRPSTIGHILASNPLALLAWIGEKFLDWTDTKPSMQLILESVTLWWLTETFPTSIYPYRQIFVHTAGLDEQIKARKPFGISWFPRDVISTPKAWAARCGDMVYFKHHEHGGHFPGFEQPNEMANEIYQFLKALESAGKY